jgi:hypothetical protein
MYFNTVLNITTEKKNLHPHAVTSANHGIRQNLYTPWAAVQEYFTSSTLLCGWLVATICNTWVHGWWCCSVPVSFCAFNFRHLLAIGRTTVNSTCMVQLVKQCILSTVIFWTPQNFKSHDQPCIIKAFKIPHYLTMYPTCITKWSQCDHKHFTLVTAADKYLVNNCRWQDKGMNYESKCWQRNVNKGLHND